MHFSFSLTKTTLLLKQSFTFSHAFFEIRSGMRTVYILDTQPDYLFEDEPLVTRFISVPKDQSRSTNKQNNKQTNKTTNKPTNQFVILG